jgi:hypothetical protein
MRTRSFVERLLRRWRGGVARLHPLGLVFRRPSARRQSNVTLTVSQTFAPRSVFDLRPRVELTLVTRAPSVHNEAARPGGERTFHETRELLVLRCSTAEPVERVVTRVLSRAAHADRRDQPRKAPASPGAVPTLLPAPPARLVVRREQPPARLPPPTAQEAHSELAQYAASAAPRSPAPGAPAPVNVEELTDRVVAAIDRRIVIASERTGRV